MRRLLEIVLVHLLLLGCAIASEQQTIPGVLVIDVYSVTVPSDAIREKDFMMWVRELKEGKADRKMYLPTLEVEHALGEAFDIAKEAQAASPPKLVVAGHVEPAAENAYKITFAELSRPPAYSGKTGLIIRPHERRVLALPMIDLGRGDNLATVVLIWYKTSDEEKSCFEIN